MGINATQILTTRVTLIIVIALTSQLLYSFKVNVGPTLEGFVQVCITSNQIILKDT